MNYYIIAGEASGDLHASNLIKELKRVDASSTFRCWGGDLMQTQGATLVNHYRDLAFMGFIEVIANLKTILRNIDFCKKDILENRPDALILVDYPGFNLRIAKFAKQQGIKVFYYISPQVWAWKQSRVHNIKKYVDRMFVILPFEKDFYKKFDYDVDFVGHPLIDAIENLTSNPSPKERGEEANWKKENGLSELPIVALLPGSRKQEINVMLNLMLEAAKAFKDVQFVIAGAPSISKDFYQSLIKENTQVRIVYNQTYQLLTHSKAALVTSGTATLETALFGVPEIVCYKGNAISYHIAKRLIKVEYISLVNLVMNREVVKELIQNELTVKNLVTELKGLLYDNKKRNQLEKDYFELKQLLGGVGASYKTAKLIYGDLKR